jgi:superfamily II DNA or RNA helicase
MLRDYQIEVKKKIYESFRSGCQSIMAQLPTGGGKTIIFSSIIKDGFDNDKKCLILAHREELVFQAADKLLKKYGVTSGIIMGGHHTRSWEKVQIASVQTLVKRPILKKFDIVIIDEAHHFSKGSTYQKIKDKILESNPACKFLGVTATPCRTNGQGFEGIFQYMVNGPSMEELINNKFLCKPKYFVAPIDLSGIKITAGDYNLKQLSTEFQKRVNPKDLVNNWFKLANNLKTIGFACDIEHSKNIVEEFQRNGVKAAHIDGTTERSIRKNIISQFEKGEIRVVYNVGIFDEGFDVESIEAVQLARPTKSLIKYMQMVGRALRPTAGKDFAVVLDHSGLIAEHDKVEIDRIWTLSGVEKKYSNKITMFRDKSTNEYYKPRELPFTANMSNIELVELTTRPKKEIENKVIEEEFLALQRFATIKNFNKFWVWHTMARKVRAKSNDKFKEKLLPIALYFCEFHGYKTGFATRLVEEYIIKKSTGK